jgi:hypothetical protein
VPWVGCPSTFFSRAEGQAGISGEGVVERTAKGLGIEPAQVAPDWCKREILGAAFDD